MKIRYTGTQSDLKGLFVKIKIRQVIIVLVMLLFLAFLLTHTTSPATLYPQVFP